MIVLVMTVKVMIVLMMIVKVMTVEKHGGVSDYSGRYGSDDNNCMMRMVWW